MRLSTWQAEGKTFTHNGHRTFYRVAGAGRTLVLLHGFPTASWDWHLVWEALAERYTLLAPDFLGYGFSDKPKRYAYSVLDHADQVEALLASRGVSSFGLLAHDYGDSVAQELLARFVNRRKAAPVIRFACLLNGGIYPEGHRPLLAQRLLLSPIGPIVSRLMNERTFARRFSQVFGPKTRPGPAELADFWHLVERDHGQAIYHLLIRYIPERRVHRDRWVGVVKSPPVPFRFINGTADPVSGRHMAELHRKNNPEADIVLLENIGHYPQTEAPAAVVDAFNAFVTPLEAN